MTSDLHIGQRVRSRHGLEGVVHRVDDGLVTVDCPSEGIRITEASDRWRPIPPDVPRDVPRAAVEDLIAAIELDHIATALRKLLGGES